MFNPDLKIYYRLVDDKIMIKLNYFQRLKGPYPTDLTMTQPSLKLSIVSFKRVFGYTHQSDCSFTEKLSRDLLIGEQGFNR